MNSKLLIPIGLVVLALVAALVILSLLDTNVEKASSSSRPTPAPTAPARAQATTPAPAQVAAQAPVSITPLARPDAPNGAITTVDQALTADTVNNEPARQAVLEMILDASTTYSVEGLVVLGPMLRHQDPAVSEAAIEGVVQLGETAGAKTLREAARRTSDPRRAARMLEAAEFLELPEYVGPPANVGTP
jgi:hypothetical protein